MEPRAEARLEVMPKFERERVLLTVLRDGRPTGGRHDQHDRR